MVIERDETDRQTDSGREMVIERGGDRQTHRQTVEERW